MKILFGSPSVVEVCEGNYYDNALAAHISRYSQWCDRLVSLAFKKEVDSSDAERLNTEGVDFVFVNKINTLKSLIWDNRKNRDVIDQQVRESDACIAHVPSFPGEAMIELARKYQKPCIVVVITCPWDAYWNYGWKGKLIAPFRYLTLRKLVKSSAYTIYVTDRFLQRRYPTTGKSIGCSNVAVEKVEDDVLEKRLYKIRYAKKCDYKLATLAAVNVRFKGQEYVIRALAKLKKAGLRFEYHLGGGGDDSFLRRLSEKLGVSDQVVFHGTIPHSEIYRLLDDTDIYIQPSKQEGLPRALIEAMSRGCPAIGSDVAGIPELLDSRFLFRKGNVDEIVCLLQNFDRVLMENQAKDNFHKAEKYVKTILEQRRAKFFSEFLEGIQEKDDHLCVQ